MTFSIVYTLFKCLHNEHQLNQQKEHKRSSMHAPFQTFNNEHCKQRAMNIWKQDNHNFQIFPSTCCPCLQIKHFKGQALLLSQLIGQGGSCMDKM